jgi:acetoacetyl-CoA synthetase
MPVREGDLLWTPPADVREHTQVGRYLGWLERERGLTFADHDALWKWSITDLEGFWSSIWDFFEVRASVPPERVLGRSSMPGAQWFPGARLNYAENLLDRGYPSDDPAIFGRSQTRDAVDLTWGELRDRVARARAGLRRLGVGRGDRVVAYLPNMPETVVAMLACASLGAVWASCSPEFGVRSAVDRFGQLEPKVLLAVGGYMYGDRLIDRRAEVDAIRDGLGANLAHVVDVAYAGERLTGAVPWEDLVAEPGPLEFEQVPPDHPIFVLFSSGTTGLPKAIVHGHAGILVEHYKTMGLNWNLRPGSRLMWFSTTGWMMWNALVSSLLTGGAIVTVDGNPGYPDLGWQWRLAEETRATVMGLSPAFVTACRKAGVQPGRDYDLSTLEQVGAAGSPMPPEGFSWIYEQLGRDLFLNVGSGGTDICSGIVGNSELLPVWAGEIAGRMLGVAAYAFDEEGRELVGEVGELVITQPMPSMPVAFWNDPDGSRLHAAYFDHYPGLWRHGDWITFTERGSCVISGRSDATLNRGGVRLGTGEIYAVIEEIDEVLDSLIVHLEDPGGGAGELLLFVVLRDGRELDDELRSSIARSVRAALSPRHVPDSLIAVNAIPRTLTGKKLEVPVKRILQGVPRERVASRDALVDPAALDAFVEYADTRAPAT